MLRKILCLSLFLFSWNIFAQNLQIIYISEVKQRLDEDVRKQFGDDELSRAQLDANENPPLEKYILFISGDESSFIYQDRLNNSQNQIFDIRYTPGGMGITYHNLKDSVQMGDYGEIYGKTYFIDDQLKSWDWKLTSERKQILGREVIKAEVEDEKANYTAWYSPEIPVSNGPAEFWGLPGLILELEKTMKEREFRFKYLAESIEVLKKGPKIKKPSKGIGIKESDIQILREEGKKRRLEMESGNIEKAD